MPVNRDTPFQGDYLKYQCIIVRRGIRTDYSAHVPHIVRETVKLRQTFSADESNVNVYPHACYAVLWNVPQRLLRRYCYTMLQNILRVHARE